MSAGDETPPSGDQPHEASQCQIECQIGGLSGFRGYSRLDDFRRLLIFFVSPPGSSPSLSTKIFSHLQVIRPDGRREQRTIRNGGRRVLFRRRSVLRRLLAHLRAGVAPKRGPALGAQGGERKVRKVLLEDGGFSQMRVAVETPFNMVLEARP